jgi:hypothetical protein
MAQDSQWRQDDNLLVRIAAGTDAVGKTRSPLLPGINPGHTTGRLSYSGS